MMQWRETVNPGEKRGDDDMQQMAQYGFKPGVAVVKTQPQYVIYALPGELPELS